MVTEQFVTVSATHRGRTLSQMVIRKGTVDGGKRLIAQAGVLSSHCTGAAAQSLYILRRSARWSAVLVSGPGRVISSVNFKFAD
jgi:hypothetical protein